MANEGGQSCWKNATLCEFDAFRQAREHAIDNLSKISLSPVEKVVLARAHKVAKWLREGLTEIVGENPIRPLDELKALGSETVCSLLWIREQAFQHKPKAIAFNVTLGSLGCASCYAPMFTSPRDCVNCKQQILLDDADALRLNSKYARIYDSGVLGTEKLQLTISIRHLRCKHCSFPPLLPQSYDCPSCGSRTGHADFRLLPSGSRPNHMAIDREFKEEIASYGSWDQ
jgi:hypothetical protein